VGPAIGGIAKGKIKVRHPRQKSGLERSLRQQDGPKDKPNGALFTREGMGTLKGATVTNQDDTQMVDHKEEKKEGLREIIATGGVCRGGGRKISR